MGQAGACFVQLSFTLSAQAGLVPRKRTLLPRSVFLDETAKRSAEILFQRTNILAHFLHDGNKKLVTDL
jgi:hypothetical protein